VLRLFLPVVLAIVLPPAATLFVGSMLVIGETDTPFGSDPAVGPDDYSGQEDMRRSLATTIAFRAGLIRMASAEEDDRLKKAQPGLYDLGTNWLPVFSEQTYCATNPSAVAIMATESYLRPTFLRRTEKIAAEILYGLTGRWPDWSFGPAQIKPSTAGRIAALAEARLADLGLAAPIDHKSEAMFESLHHPCAAIALVDISLAVASEAGDGPKEHALRHLGGVPVPTMPGVIEYTDMINMVVLVLDQAQRRMDDLNQVQDGPFGDPTFIGPPQRWIVLPGADWTEPQPRLCLRETEGSYLVDREFGPLPQDVASVPLASAILVERYPTDALWDVNTPISWDEAARILHRSHTAAGAVGLGINDLRIAAPGAYPNTEALAETNYCDAVLSVGP
jgi:hypothetical protein